MMERSERYSGRQTKIAIMKKIAEDFGTSFSDVEKIVNAQSGYAKHVMESNSMEGIAFPYLGKFVVSPRKIKMVLQGTELKRMKENGIIQRRTRKPDH